MPNFVLKESSALFCSSIDCVTQIAKITTDYGKKVSSVLTLLLFQIFVYKQTIGFEMS